jgi:hypothetical protein
MDTPRREIHWADSLPWMKARGEIAGAAAVTSLPDVSELGIPLREWRAWFSSAVKQVIASVPEKGVSLFFQSDIRHEGEWIDKGAMVARAAEEAGAHLLFHKIVCRRPPGLVTGGRPGFTHLIAVSRALRHAGPINIPDIIVDAGRLPWVRAVGIRAAAHAIRFARDQADAQVIFDPFCGVGTFPAVANTLGLPSIGIERARKRCDQARALQVGADEI